MSTDRVRRHRDRRARGISAVVHVEVTEPMVWRLADEGYLVNEGSDDEMRISRKAISAALSRMLKAWAGA